jgi:4-amino-4-deoxy-L-arabinose transferase-like glycosyltransferase
MTTPSKTARSTLWIAAAAVALVTTDLGGRILATNDEARFALLAQDILGRGDWLRPMVNGTPYFNKPPFQAWLIALASWPAGSVTQLTAVLPSALATVATALMVWGLGRRLFGSDAGRAAALALLTMQGVFLHARVPLPDMLLTALITAALWMYVRAVYRGGRSWLPFYGLVGLACWAKGPAGLLPLAVAVLDGGLRFGRQWWRRLHLPQGVAVTVVVMAPWWIVGLGADRTAMQRAVVVDQLRWYAPSVPTLSAALAPVQNVASVVFPWVIVLPLVLGPALRITRGRGAERDHVAWLLTWTVVTLVLVGLSREQRMRYYLPVAPPVALLIGWWYAGSVVQHRVFSRVPWRAYVALGGTLAAVILAVSALRPRWREEVHLVLPDSFGEAVVLGAALALMLGALLLGVRQQRLAAGFTVSCLGAALLLVAGYHWSLVRRNAAYDYPKMYATARPMLRDTAELRAWGTPALPLAFYFHRRVTPVEAYETLPALPPGRVPGVAVARASLLPLDLPPELSVVSRDRLGTVPVALVRQDAPVGVGSP